MLSVQARRLVAARASDRYRLRDRECQATLIHPRGSNRSCADLRDRRSRRALLLMPLNVPASSEEHFQRFSVNRTVRAAYEALTRKASYVSLRTQKILEKYPNVCLNCGREALPTAAPIDEKVVEIFPAGGMIVPLASKIVDDAGVASREGNWPRVFGYALEPRQASGQEIIDRICLTESRNIFDGLGISGLHGGRLSLRSDCFEHKPFPVWIVIQNALTRAIDRHFFPPKLLLSTPPTLNTRWPPIRRKPEEISIEASPQRVSADAPALSVLVGCSLC